MARLEERLRARGGPGLPRAIRRAFGGLRRLLHGRPALFAVSEDGRCVGLTAAGAAQRDPAPPEAPAAPRAPPGPAAAPRAEPPSETPSTNPSTGPAAAGGPPPAPFALFWAGAPRDGVQVLRVVLAAWESPAQEVRLCHLESLLSEPAAAGLGRAIADACGSLAALLGAHRDVFARGAGPDGRVALGPGGRAHVGVYAGGWRQRIAAAVRDCLGDGLAPPPRRPGKAKCKRSWGFPRAPPAALHWGGAPRPPGAVLPVVVAAWDAPRALLTTAALYRLLTHAHAQGLFDAVQAAYGGLRQFLGAHSDVFGLHFSVAEKTKYVCLTPAARPLVGLYRGTAEQRVKTAAEAVLRGGWGGGAAPPAPPGPGPPAGAPGQRPLLWADFSRGFDVEIPALPPAGATAAAPALSDGGKAGEGAWEGGREGAWEGAWEGAIPWGSDA